MHPRQPCQRSLPAIRLDASITQAANLVEFVRSMRGKASAMAVHDGTCACATVYRYSIPVTLLRFVWFVSQVSKVEVFHCHHPNVREHVYT